MGNQSDCHTCFQSFTESWQTFPHSCCGHCCNLVDRAAGQLREHTGAVHRLADLSVIASSGSDGVIRVGGVGCGDEDSVCGTVGLSHIQDLWSAGSCSKTHRKEAVTSKIERCKYRNTE